MLRLAVATLGLAQVVAAASSSSSSSTSGLPDTSGYVNDGDNSNIALQLYINYKAGGDYTFKQVTLATVPDDVTSRLEAAGVSSFNALDARVQRALLWDTGYTLDTFTRARKLYTLDGVALTELVVSLDEYEAVGCSTTNCSVDDNSTIAYRNFECNGEQMLHAVKCATEGYSETSDVHAAMWATGADPDGAPDIELVKHAWTDPSSNKSYEVYAIHTLSKDNEPAYPNCPASSSYGSYIIPCINVDKLEAGALASKYSQPTPSAWVDSWLAEFKDTDTSSGGGISTVAIVLIIVGVIALVIAAIVVAICVRRRRKQMNQQQFQHDPTVDPSSLLSPAASGVISTANYTKASESDSSRPTMSTNTTELYTTNMSQFGSSGYGEDGDSGSNSILRALYHDPNLAGKRLPFDEIKLEKALSKGAFGEVWVAEFRGEKVAVKRLLQNKQPTFGEFQDFTSEIQLSASLAHPNIIAFIGVAWNTINNLVMVLEFLPGGDLQSYLERQGDLLSWARDKIHVAIGLARALHYLHDRESPIIHRDLKSKNVLLTRSLEPKLIDFGVSRTQEEQMTAGVGTPYWTAPEVLEGTKYTQQSDIYSYGVLLSELDTCKIPYSDAVNATGEKLKPFQVLKEVMAGALRPTFTADCPDRIRRVAESCLLADPAARPSAKELVEMLGG